jgi:molecular chaperone GrpE
MTDNLVNIQEVMPEEQKDAPPDKVEEGVAENDPHQALQEEIANLKDQLLRALAEAENIRRRAEREREETSKYAITKFSRDLITISDTLSRALEAIPTEATELPEAVKNFIEGIKLTEKELISTFERYGIKKIIPQGEKFDHNLHQAMFEVESDEQEPGTIMQVLQAGYVLHDRLLRPAMVGVSKKP